MSLNVTGQATAGKYKYQWFPVHVIRHAYIATTILYIAITETENMPTYKLYYTNHRGRAELIRWIFKQAGVQFEDIRFTREEWLAFKPKSPYGGLPMLEIDGKLYAGTAPLVRYVAEQHGLAGSNDLENLELASIYDMTEDLILKLIPIFEEKDETRKAKFLKELEETHIPKYFGITEGVITKNGSPEGWIYGKTLTYADFRVVQTCDFLAMFCGPNFLDAYPAIVKLKKTVEALPNITKWIQERPKTEY